MSVINAVGLLAAAGGDYQISRSVRLRSSASAYFDRTFGSASTNNLKGTLSCWVKRGTLGSQVDIISCYNGSSSASTDLYFNSSNQLQFDFGNTAVNSLITTQVFRDPSAWYHIILAVDTTQATAANRCLLYVNGVQVTSFSSATYPAQNTVFQIVSINANNRIGTNWNNSGAFFDGYLTEINFIDGQALTPSSFGSYNATTGVWQPIKYTGTYGTNGFYLNFSDNSGATATTIGKDYSGNGNNWTPNNISVTAGATYDSMTDVPTLTSATAANFSTLNPLQRFDSSSFPGVYSSGNLIVASGGNPTHAFSTIQISAGDTTGYYWEGVCTSMDTNRTYIGICCPTDGPTSPGAPYQFNTKFVLYNEGQYWQASTNNGSPNGTLTSYAVNDILMIAYKNGSLWIGKNGTWMNSGDPAAGTNAVSTTLSTSKDWFAYFGYNSTWSTNFGQRPFAYTPPTGFKALNTYNLPDSTIKNGATVMAATTYTATPGTGATISNAVNGISFRPDLLWVKNRDNVEQHYWQDSVRGFSPSNNVTKMLSSNSTAAEYSLPDITCTTTSSGFTVVDSTPGSGEFWFTNRTYVAWQWQAGQGTTSFNTSGSITSTVSVNATAGFSVVTYTGTGANATVGHGLGVAPIFIILKNISSTQPWTVGQSFVGGWDRYLTLNTTNATTIDSTVWNTTNPTSTTFSIGTSLRTNGNGGTYVAYCWAQVAGFSKFGSYTGNGSADGPFVYCGFRPRWVMIKRADASGEWIIQDTSRSPSNAIINVLKPNLSAEEVTNIIHSIDILSNGFKLRDGIWSDHNANGGTLIYAAFAESPFKTSLAR